MSRARELWVAGFLGVTGLAIGAELSAAFVPAADRPAWTDLIVEYVPWPVTAVAIIMLCTWLPLHFWAAYRERRRK